MDVAANVRYLSVCHHLVSVVDFAFFLASGMLAAHQRAPETTILRIAQFHVQSHVRYVSNSLVAEELTGGGIAQSQLNLH